LACTIIFELKVRLSKDIHPKNARNADCDIILPKIKRLFGEKTFLFSAALAWNSCKKNVYRDQNIKKCIHTKFKSSAWDDIWGRGFMVNNIWQPYDNIFHYNSFVWTGPDITFYIIVSLSHSTVFLHLPTHGLSCLELFFVFAIPHLSSLHLGSQSQ
jgi:hypothetical protein